MNPTGDTYLRYFKSDQSSLLVNSRSIIIIIIIILVVLGKVKKMDGRYSS